MKKFFTTFILAISLVTTTVGCSIISQPQSKPTVTTNDNKQTPSVDEKKDADNTETDQKEPAAGSSNTEKETNTTGNAENPQMEPVQDNEKKALDLVKKKYNFVNKDDKIFDSVFGTVTIKYEAKDEKGRYIIAIRRSSDTTIAMLCYVDITTGEIEEEN